MKNPTIGIKIADGSYFPIMEEGSSKRKRLVLTTVNDNQESVQIDLYKGDGEELLEAVYVGSLLIENITRGPKESSEIELKLGFSPDGALNAEAGDPGSGQYESLSISMETLGESSMYETPEFSLDDEIEDLQIDDFDDEMEDLQLDDLDGEDQLVNPESEEISLDDEMEDLQLDDFDDEDQLLNTDSEEISLDDEMDQNFDLDSEELSLDDDDFDFDDMEEDDSLEAEDFDMDIDDTELFEENSDDFPEDDLDESADSEIEDESDYTPGILSESEMVHRKEKKGGNPFLIALLVIIAIAVIAGISYLLFRSIQGEDVPVPRAESGTEETVSEAQEVTPAEPVPEVQPEVKTAAADDTASPVENTNEEPGSDETTTVPAVQEGTRLLDTTGVWYRIRWGDTLWGISYSFYDSPKEYNQIVKENSITNPDIIFAETEIFIPSK